MKNPTPSDTHTPKERWPLLVVGLCQLLNLHREIREYRQVEAAGIFSDAAWEAYRLDQMLIRTAYALLAFLLLGMFFISLLCRTPRSTKIAQTLLFFLSALALAVSGIFLDWTAQLQTCGLWIVSLALLLGCCLYNLLKKEKG